MAELALEDVSVDGGVRDEIRETLALLNAETVAWVKLRR